MSIIARIESILGGISPTSHFAAKDQFRGATGIDPSLPIDDNTGATGRFSTVASGLIRPVGSATISGSVIGGAPLWMVANPKDANIYIYDINGSAYTTTGAFGLPTALSDGGSLSNANGNGAEYYDNYIYFAKQNDIARYGPLNGSPAFNGSYWVTTLGKTALVNTSYPTDNLRGIQYPNHVMHRHSDGKLYIADVVGNQGTIHVISTTKTTVEGDTDNGSAANKLQFGFGLWPTAIESYGSNLAIALVEWSNSSTRQTRAKIAFWDTTSATFNQITWVEFPDPLITAMKNINGILYIVSGNSNSQGFRVSRYVGGYTFEEIFYSEQGEPCFPGGIDGAQNRVLIGSYCLTPALQACVWALGLQKGRLGDGIFNVMTVSGSDSNTMITSLGALKSTSLQFMIPAVGWTKGSGSANNGIDAQSNNYSNEQVFWSQIFRIGKRFRVTRLRFPLAQQVAAGMTLVPRIHIDDETTRVDLTTVNNTNFPNSEKLIEIWINGAEGVNNFWLELDFQGATLLTVGLPIEIEYELID